MRKVTLGLAALVLGLGSTLAGGAWAQKVKLATSMGDIVVELEPGTSVFREGEPGREMFVVLDGEVELYKNVRGSEAHVASVARNDWFGEMSVLDVLPRSATTRAVAPSRLLRFTAHDLDALYRRDLRAYSLLVLNIAREMSRRLRVADGLLAEVVSNMMDHYSRRS